MLYDPSATVKNTTCALCWMPYLGSSRPVSARWHSDTVQTLFCHAGRAQERGPARQDGAQMTHSHGPCGHRGALTKYGQAHSLLYHNRRGMQQLIIPPALPPGSKARLSSLVTDTQTVCCAAFSSFVYTIISSVAVCPVETTACLPTVSSCHSSTVDRSQIWARLASAVVSNGSADINMAQLISECLGIKG